jgi:hypothetical protein
MVGRSLENTESLIQRHRILFLGDPYVHLQDPLAKAPRGPVRIPPPTVTPRPELLHKLGVRFAIHPRQ